MTERRAGHPFHMYEAIRRQPEAFARMAERHRGRADELADGLARVRRLFLVGIGTSHHAATVGEHLMRLYGGGVDVRAVHAFDFALFGPELSPEDAVVAVSHRGAKRYTAAALERARRAGCATALVRGEGGAGDAGRVFETVAQEVSSAHTVSYTSAVAVLALLAAGVGARRTGRAAVPEGLLEVGVPEALEGALQTEGDVEVLAREHVGRRRIWLAGGGPSAVTAAETALKIRESSYLQAEGLPTETLLHGPFQCVEAEDVFVLAAPADAARGRTLELAELAREVGAPCFVVDDGGEDGPDVPRVRVPPVPEPFAALTCLAPLQLFAYHLALVRGTNPDSFRAEDPRFARADVSARL